MSAPVFERKYRVIDYTPPTAVQLALDKTLEQYMQEHVAVDSAADVEKRKRALAALSDIFRSWVKHVAVHEQKMPLEQVEEVGGAMLVSGSFRLGVHEPGADIDTVCVAPIFCTKTHFFSSLKSRLQTHPQVRNLLGVESAHVPILTFDFDNINIDLSLATLPHKTVSPSLDVLDDKILQGVDPSTAVSLNGPRVTNMIEKYVSCAYRERRVYERWSRRIAQQKMSETNGMTLSSRCCGGVNFNILVAMVCQLYPRASLSTLLKHFFNVYTHWNWAITDKPVQLTNTVDHNMLLEVWRPEKNRHHLMPIITPAYPAMNSAYNVNQFSLGVMKDEFARGKEVCGRVLAQGGRGWEELFEPTEFFVMYRRYLACNIIAAGGDEASEAWIGFVASRMRRMPECLGKKLPLERAHLLPIKFPTTISANSHCYFVGFEIDATRCRENTIDMIAAVEEFKTTEMGRYREAPDGCEFHCEVYQWSQLPDVVFKDLGGKSTARELRKRERKKSGFLRQNKRRAANVGIASAEGDDLSELDKTVTQTQIQPPAEAAATDGATRAENVPDMTEDESSARAIRAKKRRRSEGMHLERISDVHSAAYRVQLPQLLPLDEREDEFGDTVVKPSGQAARYPIDGLLKRKRTRNSADRANKRIRSVTFEFLY